MTVSDVTLDVGEQRFPGRLNEPDTPTGRGVLVIPGAGHGPFGDVFDRFAAAAAGAGHPVARFETWSSHEELDAKTDAALREEIDAGIEFLRSRDCATVALVAKSFGGRLALAHAPDGAERMVLWAPAVRFGEHEDEPSITAGTLADVDVPVRILQGDADHSVLVESAPHIAATLPNGELVELPGEDHSFQNDEALVVEETLSFLAE